MKQTFKRLQALALVLAMCVSFLQIPSFAVACVDNSTVVSGIDFPEKGKITYTTSCEAHVNEATAKCVKNVTGTIVEAKDGSYSIVGSDGKKLNDVTIDAVKTGANCSTAGTIVYKATYDGKTYKSDEYTTEEATGKHNYGESTAKNYDELMADSYYVLVDDTATCQEAGKATFAAKCNECGYQSPDKLVTVEHVVGHTYIKETKDGKETDTDKVFTEEVTAATCTNKGSELHYYQCKYCGTAFYLTSEADTKGTTAKAKAEKFEIPTLPHTFEYTITTQNENGIVTAQYTPENATDVQLKAAFKVTGKCAVDNKTTAYGTVTKVVEDKTQLVKPNGCKAGSRTFTVTYKVTDYSKKDVNGYGTKEVTEVVTVPYYTNPQDYEHHTWSENTTTDKDTYVQATCTKDGHLDQVYTCTVCGEKKIAHTITTPATGKHTAADAVKENVVAATYAKAGSYDLVTRCADCGEVLSSTHKTVAKLTVNKSSISKVKNVKTKKAQVTIKKASSVTGYQIQYSTSSKYKSGNKSVKTKKTSYTIKNLKKGKKYYVRVRSYKTVDGKTYYSSWSGSKTVTIKK